MTRAPLLPTAGLLALLGPAVLAQSNASAYLITYGDVIQGNGTAVLSGLTPNVPAYLVPSLTDQGSNYLVGLSGDPNDWLSVGIDLAAQGTYFQGTSNAQGRFSVSFRIQATTALLDRRVYWQGFTRPGSSGANMFQDFTNLRVMSLNTANRWQAPWTDMPQAAASVAFVATEAGDNGRPIELLICGGGPALVTNSSTPYYTTDKAWTYDVLRERHNLLPGRMNVSRAFHNAIRLADGRVLVAGGVTFGGLSGSSYYTEVLNSAEIYDPATGAWTLVPPMGDYRAGATANLLPDGRVLVAGGTEGNAQHRLFDVNDLLTTSLKSTEIYNPATNAWSWGPNMPEPKAGAGSAVLADGRVFIAGGITWVSIIGIRFPDFSDNASIYNPATNSFTTATMRNKRAMFGVTRLNDGRVVCAGGAGGDIFNVGPIRQMEIYAPAANQFTSLPNLPYDAAFPVAVTLADGRAMIVGGATGTLDDPVPIALCSIYDPIGGSVNQVAALAVAHAGGAVATLEDATVYCGGGESNNGSATLEAETYSP